MKSQVQIGPERFRYYGNISASARRIKLQYPRAIHLSMLTMNLSHSDDLSLHMDTVHVILMYIPRVLQDADVEVEDVSLHYTRASLVVIHPEASVIKSI